MKNIQNELLLNKINYEIYILLPLLTLLYRLSASIFYIVAIIIIFILVFLWHFKIDIKEEFIYTIYNHKVDNFFQPDINKMYYQQNKILYTWSTLFHYVWGLKPLNNK